MMAEKGQSGSAPVLASYPKGLLNGALVLAAITGLLHLYIGVVIDGLPTGIPLVLIGLVYFGGIGLISANYKRDLLMKVGLGWVTLVIVLWALAAAVNGTGTRDPLSFLDKADEVVLLGLLLRIRMLRSRSTTVR
jgi:hypothetical protein